MATRKGRRLEELQPGEGRRRNRSSTAGTALPYNAWTGGGGAGAAGDDVMPDRNTQWSIGTIIVVELALTAQMSSLRSEMNQRFAQLEAEMNQRFAQLDSEMNQRFAEVNRRLDAFDQRLRAVEVAFAKVVQRLETIERIVLPDGGGGTANLEPSPDQ